MATYSGSDKRLQYLFQHGGGRSLEDLDDVEITNPSDGDALVYDEEEEKWVNGEGGGGNANEQVLTKAEYDALTEEEKMNNTTYYINDADTWTSKEVQPVIYSTEEREIGVWTDGKPLYQKTIIVNNPTNNTDLEYDIGVTDLDEVISQEGTWDRDVGSGGIWTYDLNATNERSFTNSFIVIARIRNGTKKLYVYVGTTYSNVPRIRFTFRYTKTTDTAGSGIYTPQGQLAVHYSTEEHVIGTWIDGKTLYEKTINFTTGNSGSYLTYDTGIQNPDTCMIDFSGSFFVYSATSRMGASPYSGGTYMEETSFKIYPAIVDNKIRFDYRVGNNAASKQAWVTVRYTKTTD